jgi:Prephenate dehydratase
MLCVYMHICMLLCSDVFDAVSSVAHFGVVPQENSIFGAVIETYDNLRRPGMGFVRGDVTLDVQHCLVAPKGAKMEQIKSILSHEQVS